MNPEVGLEVEVTPSYRQGKWVLLVVATLLVLSSDFGQVTWKMNIALFVWSPFHFQQARDLSQGTDAQHQTLTWSQTLAACLPYTALALVVFPPLLKDVPLLASCSLATPLLAYFTYSSIASRSRFAWLAGSLACLLPLSHGLWGSFRFLAVAAPWLVTAWLARDWCSRISPESGQDGRQLLLAPLKNTLLIWVAATATWAALFAEQHYQARCDSSLDPFTKELCNVLWQSWWEPHFFFLCVVWGVGLPLAAASERIRLRPLATALSISAGATSGMLFTATLGARPWPLQSGSPEWLLSSLVVGGMVGFQVARWWSPPIRSTDWIHPFTWPWVLLAWLTLKSWLSIIAPPPLAQVGPYPEPIKAVRLIANKPAQSLQAWLSLAPPQAPRAQQKRVEEALGWMKEGQLKREERIEVCLVGLPLYPLLSSQVDGRRDFYKKMNLAGSPLTAGQLARLKAVVEADQKRDEEVVERLSQRTGELQKALRESAMSPFFKPILAQRFEHLYRLGAANILGRQDLFQNIPDYDHKHQRPWSTHLTSPKLPQTPMMSELYQLNGLLLVRKSLNLELQIHEQRLQQGRFPKSIEDFNGNRNLFQFGRGYYTTKPGLDSYSWQEEPDDTDTTN